MILAPGANRFVSMFPASKLSRGTPPTNWASETGHPAASISINIDSELRPNKRSTEEIQIRDSKAKCILAQDGILKR